MSVSILFVICFVGYFFVRRKLIREKQKGNSRLRSRIGQYHIYAVLVIVVPSIVGIALWEFFEPAVIRRLIFLQLPENFDTIYNPNLFFHLIQQQSLPASLSNLEPYYNGSLEYYLELKDKFFNYQLIFTVIAGLAMLAYAYSVVDARFNARKKIERFILYFLIFASTIAILTSIGIVLSLLFESIEFFRRVPFLDFILGTHWSPQVAVADHQTGSSGSFGFLPILWGTLFISFIALFIAIPLGLMTAIYLSEYMNSRLKNYIKPAIEILAGIPTIVYGFLAVNVISPIFQDVFGNFQIALNSESALIAGCVIGIMLIPFISSLSEDVISTVPSNIKDAAYGIGSTKSEVILRVLLPASMQGIIGSVILAMSRAVGETMIVVMAAGLVANFTVNPLEAVTTVTVQIVTLLVGDQEFDNVKTFAAFALGFTLFFVTLILNLISLYILKKYQKNYE